MKNEIFLQNPALLVQRLIVKRTTSYVRLLFLETGGKRSLCRKFGLILVIFGVFFNAPIHAQQTLCQQFGSTPANITIGTPINNNIQSITFLSTLYPNGANLQNQKIRINGILKVDRALTLNNCTVELEGGALIVTDGANTISSNSSRYYSCGTMWQGFFIKSTGAIILNWGEIEDAEAALLLDDGAAATIAFVLFDRNHIAIRNGSATAGPASINFIGFLFNTFDCSSALSTPFHLNLSPAWTGTSFAGIYLNTAVGTINSVWANSSFKHMHFGVFAENSDVTIAFCEFENMVAHPTILNSINGIRVSGGALSASYCIFHPLPGGHSIWAEGAELNVHHNSFTITGFTGISSSNNLNTDFIYIRDNTLVLEATNILNFGNYQIGISVDRNSRSSAGNINLTSFDISRNIFTMNGLQDFNIDPTSFSQRGILITGTVPSLDIGLIFDNSINANVQNLHLQNGIEVRAGFPDRFNISDNDVIYNDPIQFQYFRRWAISMLYGTGSSHFVHNNNSLAVGNSSEAYCGIHLEDIPNVTLCSNFTENHSQGIHFYGVCNALGFWENTMHTSSSGLIKLQDNTASGSQGFMGTHIRTANRFSIGHGFSTSTWTAFPPNLIVVQNNAQPAAPSFWTPTTFGNAIPGPENYCLEPAGFNGEKDGELTGYDNWVKDGTGGASPANSWEAKRNFLYKLSRFPGLKNVDPTINNFYDTNINTTAGKFAQVDNLLLQSVQQITEVQNNSISTFLTNRDVFLAQLKTMDENNNANTPTTLASQIASKQALLDTWKANFNSRVILKQQIASQRLNKISQAQQLLQNISTTNTQEASWKTIRTVHLNRVIGIADNESTLNQLRDIATQCPEQAGNSAILALYMLPNNEITTHLPNEEIGLTGNCNPRSEKNHNHNGVPFETMNISPNPTKDWISVEFPSEVSGIWEILNLQGRIVRTGKIEKSLTFLIETAPLPIGSYLLKVSSDEGRHYVQRFVISY